MYKYAATTPSALWSHKKVNMKGHDIYVMIAYMLQQQLEISDFIKKASIEVYGILVRDANMKQLELMFL